LTWPSGKASHRPEVLFAADTLQIYELTVTALIKWKRKAALFVLSNEIMKTNNLCCSVKHCCLLLFLFMLRISQSKKEALHMR